MLTIALVAASDFNASYFHRQDEQGVFDKVIAVDGGYASLKQINRLPDLALGDFDSLGFVPIDVETRVFSPKKDKSDLELALDYATLMEADECIIYGALGKRLDHTIANLQLFAAFAEKGLTIKVVDEQSILRFLVGPASLTIPAQDSGTVSVFSLTDSSEGVSEEGLEYSLSHAILTNRTSLGLSNEYIGHPATISVKSGTLAVFTPLNS